MSARDGSAVPVGPEPQGLSVERLAEIRDRAGIATEGPWRVVEGHEIHQGAEFGDFAVYVAQTDPDCGCVQSVADAEFIAHAREDVPALLTDNDRLRARVAELEAQRERRRVRLVALSNDALNMRGALSPMGEARKVPMPLGESLLPAVEWLIGRVAELEARPSPADVLREAADDLTAACPEHSDADEAWMDCPCEFADELRRKAMLVGSGEGEPSLSFAERAGRETNPGRRAAWRMLAEPLEDPHDSPLHHTYRVPRDLPETGGAK